MKDFYKRCLLIGVTLFFIFCAHKATALPPVVSGSSSITYVENSFPAVINSNITVSDPDNTTLS